MSNLKSEIIFPNSGLDTDTAYEYMQVGDSPYRLHIQVSHEGASGVIENMKGNHLASYTLNLSNSYRVGGSTYDRLNRKVYFFIFSQPYDWSSSGDYQYDNRLLVFDEDNETIELVFWDTRNYFGINPTVVVKDCDILGDWLFFNPRTSEPKMIDVVRAKNYTDYDDYDAASTYVLGNKVKYFGGIFLANAAVAVSETPCTNPELWDRVGNCYQDASDTGFDSEFRYAFNVIKHVPVYRPSCSYGSDLTRTSNNVAQKVFQFTHRYKYFDDSYSKFSNFSDVTLPQNDEVYNGEIADAAGINNYISVQVQLHSPALVKQIEIAFREVGGDWKLAKVINRQEQTTLDDTAYSYNFYNTDAAYVVIDEELFSEPFDSVPQKAQAQELINKNILTYGGVTEGFDNLDKEDIDVTLTPQLIPLTNPSEPLATLRDNVASGDITQNETIYSDGYTEISYYHTEIDLGATFLVGLNAGDEYSVTINGVRNSYTLVLSDLGSAEDLATAIADFLNSMYSNTTSGWGCYTDGDTVIVDINITYLDFTESIFYTVGSAQASLAKYRGFKTGAWHPFCIFYYDKAMRRCDAQTSKENNETVGYAVDGTTVYVPMFNELSPLSDTATKWNIDWEIRHAPPSYAKWWRWGYAGNALCSWFVQYTVTAFADDAPWTTIDISPLQDIAVTYPQTNVNPYQWVKGDRVRFITQASSGDMGALVDGIYDYEIVRLDEDTNLIYIQDFDYAAVGCGEDTLIEIYRPRKTDVKTIYYEFGDIFPIVEDSGENRVHGGSLQNQDIELDLPATGIFSNGDVYHIVRTPSKQINGTEGYFMESQWYSDFYDSDMYDRGREGFESNFNQRTLNIIRYSNQYLQNTGINGLTTFEADNYKELNDIYGTIQAMVEVGNTLKVYMEKKSASILIGRQEYTDSEGQSVIATSERVLGSVRYPESNLGTQWIESVTKNNKFVYGYDIFNGVLWRDSVNGIFPVSGKFGTEDYKMETYFRQKAEALSLSGREYTTVMTVWDERYDCLWVIFRDLVNSDNDDVIAFHEPSNRWITFADFTQTPSEGYNVMLELDYWVLWGFEAGIGFSFDEDTRFAVFDIETPPDVLAFPDVEELTYTLQAPTITVDCTVSMDLLSYQVSSLPAPEVITPYVTSDTPGLSWAATELHSQYITITCNPATCTLTSFPSWLRVLYNGNVLSAGSVVTSGSLIQIYPPLPNTGGLLTSTIVFTNTYGNTATINVQRLASVAPTVSVLASSNASNVLTVLTGSGSASIGTTYVSIAFTCEHPDYVPPATFVAYWTATITRSGVTTDAGGGSWSDVVESAANNKDIYLTQNTQTGDIVRIYLLAYGSGSTVTDGTATPDLLSRSLVITDYPPTIFITELSPVPTGATWTYDQSGIADTATITVTYKQATQTRVLSYPSWLMLIDSDGNDLRGGHYIYRAGFEDEDIRIYPISDNLSGLDLSGVPVVLTNEMSETANITVTHYKEALAKAITLSISGSDYTGLSFHVGASRTATVYSTTTIQFTGVFDCATQSAGAYFPVYWRCYVNSVSRGSGNFTARNAMDEWSDLSGYVVTEILPLTGVTLDKYSDTIVIYFSGNSI